ALPPLFLQLEAQILGLHAWKNVELIHQLFVFLPFTHQLENDEPIIGAAIENAVVYAQACLDQTAPSCQYFLNLYGLFFPVVDDDSHYSFLVEFHHAPLTIYILTCLPESSQLRSVHYPL